MSLQRSIVCSHVFAYFIYADNLLVALLWMKVPQIEFIGGSDNDSMTFDKQSLKEPYPIKI